MSGKKKAKGGGGTKKHRRAKDAERAKSAKKQKGAGREKDAKAAKTGKVAGSKRRKAGKKPKPKRRDEPGRMKRSRYESELRELQGELVAMQEWVKATGAKICIVFEGRDTAGKGGVIKRITERVSPRVFRVVALPAPTDREKSQMYIQRYVQHFPAAGEVVIFDRSWYNRAGVERVMGFATPEQVERFLDTTPAFEKSMADSGILLVKYWLEVSPEEQTRRLQSRLDDPRKVWKLTAMDLESYTRWDDYTEARDAMFTATDTGWAPWYVVDSNDKKRARLAVIGHLLRGVSYDPLTPSDVALPERSVSTVRMVPPGTGHRVALPT